MEDKPVQPTEGIHKKQTEKPKLSLADQKTHAETKLVLEKIKTERNSRNPGSLEQLKSFLPAIVTLVSIAAAMLAFWGDLQKYLAYKEAEEIRKAKESNFQFNDKMVTLVNDLDNNKTSDRAVMLLSYFGHDAIPILLFKLERTDKDSSNNVIVSIAEIYHNAAENDTILHKILHNAEKAFDYQARYRTPDNRNLDALDNYFLLFEYMGIKEQDHIAVLGRSLSTIQTSVQAIQDEGTKDPLLSQIEKIRNQYGIKI